MKPTRLLYSVLFLLLVPAAAAAQTGGKLSLQAAGGLIANAKYPANTVSASFAFSPVSRIDIAVAGERLYVPTTEEFFSGGSYGVTRGGVLTFASAELRASLFPPDRVSPFLIAGIGAGLSRPNVNARFPVPVENGLRVVYLGGGVRVPLGKRVMFTADARGLLGVEDIDGIVGVIPVRAGITWRF